jgi:hypothetical protein
MRLRTIREAESPLCVAVVRNIDVEVVHGTLTGRFPASPRLMAETEFREKYSQQPSLSLVRVLVRHRNMC